MGDVRMDLSQLRGFLETAREKSFTRAAEKLFLTQPAVSLQIKALEEELGERLFERRGKQVLLTEAGRLLFVRAEEILEKTEQARQDLTALRELRTGRLCIGTSDTNCAYVLPPAVKAFRRVHPGVEIRLTDRMSPEVVRLVLEGGVDFGLATLPVSEPRVQASPLFLREDVAICHPEHPLARAGRVSVADLGGHTMLALEQGSTSRGLMDRLFAEVGVVATVSMELGSIEVMKRFVEIGLGIALVPEVAVREEVQAGRLCALRVEGLPARQVGIVQRAGGRLSVAAHTFLGYLKDHLAELGLQRLDVEEDSGVSK
ncbi:MAG: LysR family transcriptional regulator [bacterium]|nr:LysR family transcriptional regulator [bacterium]